VNADTCGWPGHNNPNEWCNRRWHWRSRPAVVGSFLILFLLSGSVRAAGTPAFKILYVVATLTANQTIESAGRWDTFEQCEAARMAVEASPDKTILALSSSCVLADKLGGLLGGFGGGSGGFTTSPSTASRSVSPSR